MIAIFLLLSFIFYSADSQNFNFYNHTSVDNSIFFKGLNSDNAKDVNMPGSPPTSSSGGALAPNIMNFNREINCK